VKLEFKLMAKKTRDDALASLIRAIHKLPADKPWQVTIEKYKKRRSNSQNAYLWGVCYPNILEQGGEQLAGWTKDDLHSYMLGEHFGWETLEGFGRKRMRPIRRSSKLSTMEFQDYVAFIQQKAAELGIVIPDPNEEVQ
jgi:hypothetical protein